MEHKSCGSCFYSWGTATKEAQSPQYLNLGFGTNGKEVLVDHKVLSYS